MPSIKENRNIWSSDRLTEVMMKEKLLRAWDEASLR